MKKFRHIETFGKDDMFLLVHEYDRLYRAYNNLLDDYCELEDLLHKDEEISEEEKAMYWADKKGDEMREER